MASKPPFELEARTLSPEDAAWLTLFDAGGEWWCEEVSGFLRQHALAQSRAGYSTTILFSMPGEKHVIGFLAISATALKLAQVQGAYPRFGPAPGIETKQVPVWLIPYFGVNAAHHRQHFGEEMYAWLLLTMEQAIGAPRFVYLQCWEENAHGVKFWRRLGFMQFDRTQSQRADKRLNAPLLWFILDRFSITPPEQEPK